MNIVVPFGSETLTDICNINAVCVLWGMKPSVKCYWRKLRPVSGLNDSTRASVRCLSRVMCEQIPVCSPISLCIESHDSLSRYGSYATGWIAEESWFDSRQGQEIFLFFSVQTGSRAHPSSCQWAPGVKRPAHEADHSPAASAQVKKGWSCAFYSSVCLHDVNRDNSTFSFFLHSLWAMHFDT